MANLKMKNIFFGVVLVMGIFLNADAQAPNSFCTGGVEVNPEVKDLCTHIVGGSKTWADAALASVKRLSVDATKPMRPLIATIDSQLSKTIAISDRSQIIQTCKDSYRQASDDLKKCPGLITSGPFSSYESTLTSIYTAIEDCKDAIAEEKGQAEIPEVTKYTKDIQKLVDVTLVIAKKDPRLAQYTASLASGEFKDSAGDPNLIGPISNSFYGANPSN